MYWFKSLDFGVDGELPSADPTIQYNSNGVNPFGIPETGAYSVQGGLVMQRTVPYTGWSDYISFANQFNPVDGILIEARLRINEIEVKPDPTQPTLYYGGGAYFGAYDGTFFVTATGINRIPLNSSIFHTYSISKAIGSNHFTTFVDGVLVETAMGGPINLDGFGWGDGRSLPQMARE